MQASMNDPSRSLNEAEAKEGAGTIQGGVRLKLDAKKMEDNQKR